MFRNSDFQPKGSDPILKASHGKRLSNTVTKRDCHYNILTDILKLINH